MPGAVVATAGAVTAGAVTAGAVALALPLALLSVSLTALVTLREFLRLFFELPPLEPENRS